MKLSIIIPVYNEENSILEVLDQLLKLKFPEIITDWEIVIVDDCSTDNSAEKIKKYIADKENIRYIKHQENRGKGASVRTGIKEAAGDVFLFQDADLELSPKDIPRMIEIMDELDVELVNGSRYLTGLARPLSSYKRYLANRFFTFLTSLAINVKISDMACGYKLIHRKLMESISLKENRFGFEAELIIKALRIKKNNITEIPVQYFPRNVDEGKKLSSIDGIKILWTIFKYGILRLN